MSKRLERTLLKKKKKKDANGQHVCEKCSMFLFLRKRKLKLQKAPSLHPLDWLTSK